MAAAAAETMEVSSSSSRPSAAMMSSAGMLGGSCGSVHVLAGRAAAVYHTRPATPSSESRFRLMAPRPIPSPETSSMSVAVDLDALVLAALLVSRVGHDLISPAGAIVNGLEVLEEEDSDEETKTFALELIKRSAKTASARLQFCRLAFGSAGAPGGTADLGDAQAMARALIEDEKTKLAWNLPSQLLPKNRVKLLLNLLVIGSQSIPRGGTLSVDPVGAGDGMGFRIAAAGVNARIPHGVPALLQGRSEDGSIDAHAIQPFYAGLLARAC